MYTIEDKLKNEERLWREVSEKKTFLSSLPPRLTLQTHQRCNFACRFCYHFTNKYYLGNDPSMMGYMQLRHIKALADEIFPTLQYYEATLLGDPFLSLNFDEEIKLAQHYHVFFRPTTNISLLTEKKIEQVNGAMDWLKCSFDSHIRGIYNAIKIGVRFERVVEKLKMFAKMRYQMDPVPYFRVGFVLTDLNMDTLPEYIRWCNDELGVDDVEVMGLNVDHHQTESLGVFDQVDRVNDILERSIDTAHEHKVKLRLAFTRMPGEGTKGKDRYVSQIRSQELREEQRHLGFIQPRAFDRMSYVIRNERNRGDIGDLGYVWSNDMRRHDLCEEFFNRPFMIWNGNVEACGNCNTFYVGNIYETPFREIWNCELYQKARKKMYEGPIDTWYSCCHDCICMFVTYDRATSDHRFSHFWRIVNAAGKMENKSTLDEHAIKLKDKAEGKATAGASALNKIKHVTKDWVPPILAPHARRAYQILKRWKETR